MPGESRVAIINRRHRISGTEFLSQIARKEVEREARQKKQKEALVSDRRIVNIIQNLASNGSGREDTIAQALRIGATLDQVGRALGISRQRVHQIRKRNRMTETSKD
jgi:DNA-directed RNA polymerase sigma subunit (sigma70/sigma32)